MKQDNSASRWIALSWLLLVLVLASLAFSKGAIFDSSIISLLPESEQRPVVQQATDVMAERFSRRLIVLLSGKDEAGVRSAVEMLAGSLSKKSEVAEVVWRVTDDEISRFHDELYPYRFAMVEPGIRESLLAKDFDQIKQQALFKLFSPLSLGGGEIIGDPFGFFSALALSQKSDLNIQVYDSLLKIPAAGVEKDGLSTYMLMVHLAAGPFSGKLQREVLGVIEQQKKVLRNSGISFDMSGMLIHAEAGARQARNEIFTIGIGSLLGIVIAILLVFRELKPLLLMLFSVSVGCVCAAAVTMLVFERVHLITFAFGAGLVGVSIDYALHFLCERRASSAENVLRKLLPGLLLGLFSSVMAYSAQALTPFPGLQQMAVFSVVGLVASWLTVVLWFPILTGSDARRSLGAAGKLDQIRKRFPYVQNNPALILTMLIIFILAINTISKSDTLDDIRLLQTSPDSLLAQEKKVQEMLGISSSSQFLVITADTFEQCLQKEERLISDLERLKQEGSLKGYQTLSSVLPSLKRQAENTAMIQKLYDEQLVSFYARLKVSEDDLSFARLQLAQSREKLLTPEVWLRTQVSENWKDLIVTQTTETVATVIRFSGALDEVVKQKLMVLSDEEEGVFYVDKIKDISTLMSNYRSQIIKWIVLAYLCVFIVLLYRYKRQVWRVVLPPVFASMVTLAILVHLEQGLNLFHLMALILVLGIGLDMGIFLMETDENSYTWLAVSLSSYTSLLAFGMLAWSDTPVLHHFGLTVLLGLAIVWLITPLMRKNNLQDIAL